LLLVFADHGDDGEAARCGEFDGEPADAAGGTSDDQDLAVGQFEVGKASPGGKPVQADRRELGRRQTLGDEHGVADRQSDQGGLGAAQALEPQAESQDPRPGDRRVDALAGRYDTSGEIPAGGIGPGGPHGKRAATAPVTTAKSAGLTVAASVAIRTSPWPGLGSVTSATVTCSIPNSPICTAFTKVTPPGGARDQRRTC
jgi:hypothetical protein